MDHEGRLLARRRVPEGVVGLAALHALVADRLDDPGHPGRGGGWHRGRARPCVQALAKGFTVYTVNPLQVARYRQRHVLSGAKSDPADAHTLAELVRLDRAHHRQFDGGLGDRRARQGAGTRASVADLGAAQRQANVLRSMLREFYPGALVAVADDLAGRDALAVLSVTPSPRAGAALSVARVQTVLRRAGRQRNIQTRADQIVAALHSEELQARPGVGDAYAVSPRALVAVITELVRQEQVLLEQIEADLGRHPAADIYLSQPRLGIVLSARVLAEFGDASDRYDDAKSRRNYAGTSPITRASGKSRAVLARHVRNRRVADALYLQAFAALRLPPAPLPPDRRRIAAEPTAQRRHVSHRAQSPGCRRRPRGLALRPRRRCGS